MNNLPPIPTIDDTALFLDVYTHKSIKTAKSDEYGDTERLAILGGKVFDLAVTSALFNAKPMLQADEIREKITEYTSDAQIGRWIEAYKLKEKLLHTQDYNERINSPEETRFFFHSYVGAVYFRNGASAIQQWVARMIDPDTKSSPPPSVGSPPQFPINGMNPQQQWPPAQPAAAPPPLPPTTSNKGAPSLGILALFNQTATQQGISVNYQAEKTGPSHAPIWTVHCVVENIPRGVGHGKSQKIAKEEAAKQAWASMGWSPAIGV